MEPRDWIDEFMEEVRVLCHERRPSSSNVIPFPSRPPARPAGDDTPVIVRKG